MARDATIGRRERKKQRTREALEQAAWRLFDKKGYDETTIEDISDAADVSPRTFFRYFESKEAVLFGDWRGQLELVRPVLIGRPTDEALLASLQELAVLSAARMESDPSVMEAKRIAKDSRTVRDYERLVMMPAIEDLIAELLAERLGVSVDDDPRPRLFSSVGMAILLAAKRQWVDGGGEGSLVALTREAFDLVIG